MKIFNNHYFFSIITAVLTGVFLAFTVLFAWQWIENFIPVEVPLYSAGNTVEVVRNNPQDVDAENAATLPITLPPINGNAPATATTTAISAAKKKDISAQAYLVASIDSTSTIASKDSNRARPIASLTKLATAAVALDLLNQNETVTIGPKVLSTYYGDPAGFRNKETIKVSQLFYPLLMVSSNDAGEALARSYDGGRQKFIKAMNDWAYSIGAYNTYFADPTGLSPENVSSPHDLAVMLGWIYKNRPELIDITHTKVKYLGMHTWINPTQLLNLSTYVGGKNGYIPEAGQTSASIFDMPTIKTKVDNIFIIITLASENRNFDVLSLINKI